MILHGLEWKSWMIPHGLELKPRMIPHDLELKPRMILHGLDLKSWRILHVLELKSWMSVDSPLSSQRWCSTAQQEQQLLTLARNPMHVLLA